MHFAPDKRFVATSKGDIYYFVAGPHDSTQTVMLLHGLSSNHTTWLTLMEKLSAQGIRSIAPDLRGHGFSDQSKDRDWYEFSTFANDIHCIATQEHLRKFDIVGYSFGGYVALAYAASNSKSLRSMTLVSAGFRNPGLFGLFRFLAPLAAALLEAAAWLCYPQHRRRYDYFEYGKNPGYFRSTFKGLFTMPLSVNFWMLARVHQLDLRSALPRITCPTLIVRSSTDPYLTRNEVVEMMHKLKHVCTVTITEGGHHLASRNQETLAHALLPFLKDPSRAIILS